MIHYGLLTFSPNSKQGDGTLDPKLFNPTQLDAEQWVLAGKSVGAKYLVLVVKHHDGFCLFPSRMTKYSVESSPWKNGKGDLVAEVEKACRKHGLKFGVYMSPHDAHEPKYKESPAAYDEFFYWQIRELASRYGELAEFWLDGWGSVNRKYNWEWYIQGLRKQQPNTLVFAPLRDKRWFWRPDEESRILPLASLLDMYHTSVGRGCQLMLGVVADQRGLVPEPDVARLKEFGQAVRKIYSDNLARSGQHRSDAGGRVDLAFDGDPDTFWSAMALQNSYFPGGEALPRVTSKGPACSVRN